VESETRSPDRKFVVKRWSDLTEVRICVNAARVCVVGEVYGERGLGLLGWEKPQLFSTCRGTGEEKAY